MGALADARRHLDKAREFLDSAVDELDFERFNAAQQRYGSVIAAG